MHPIPHNVPVCKLETLKLFFLKFLNICDIILCSLSLIGDTFSNSFYIRFDLGIVKILFEFNSNIFISFTHQQRCGCLPYSSPGRREPPEIAWSTGECRIASRGSRVLAFFLSFSPFHPRLVSILSATDRRALARKRATRAQGATRKRKTTRPSVLPFLPAARFMRIPCGENLKEDSRDY